MMVKDCFMSSDGSCAVVVSEMSMFYGGECVYVLVQPLI